MEKLGETSGTWLPGRELVDLMVGLAHLPTHAHVFVCEPDNTLSERMAAEGHHVVSVTQSDPWEMVSRRIHASNPFDAAILFPHFGQAKHSLRFPPGWPTQSRGFLEDHLIANVIDHLAPLGVMVALVPNGLLSNYGRKEFRRELVRRGIAAVASVPAEFLGERFTLSLIGIVYLERARVEPARRLVFFNGDRGGLPELSYWERAVNGDIASGMREGVMLVDAQSIDEETRLDPQYYDPEYLHIEAPAGYRNLALGEISETRGGYAVSRDARHESKDRAGLIPYLQVRHITANHQISDDTLWVETKAVNGIREKQALPGDILITVSGTVGKAVVVPKQYSDGVLFDTSLRRIRVTAEGVSADEVAGFLQSDIGQLQLRRLTGGSVIPYITTSGLEGVRVFLPEVGSKHSEHEAPPVGDASAQAKILADSLRVQLIEPLLKVQPDDTGWRERFDSVLRKLAGDLLQKGLDAVVLEDFPAPLAIPYRRYLMAHHNPYEQLDRMVSVVEACVYFVFHVLLADFGRQKWKLELTGPAKEAHKGKGSAYSRLVFIKQVLDAASEGKVTLYMPQLASSSVVKVGDMVRDNVRNPTAHSAPGSEPYIRSLVSKYQADVQDLLRSLSFLSDYKLCRIRYHHYRNGQWFYQAELYQGAEYDTNIQEMPLFASEDDLDYEQPERIEADQDHLVLVSPDRDTLDLYPFYQLYYGDETCRESHLCFMKERESDGLTGESIRSGVEVSMPGKEDYFSASGCQAQL